MKLWKHTLISAIAFFGIATTVLYTSCEKDSCLELTCRNGGSCAEGFCRCPTGFEGTECEIKTVDKFIGTFYGSVKCGELPPVNDTVEVWLLAEPNLVEFVQHSRIEDTMVGVAAGNALAVDQQSFGNYKKNVSVTLDRNKMTLYFEEIYDINTGDKAVCYFIGFR